ncbi:hypothetical protein GCM10009834_02040 [Streptomonospora arabica]
MGPLRVTQEIGRTERGRIQGGVGLHGLSIRIAPLAFALFHQSPALASALKESLKITTCLLAMTLGMFSEEDAKTKRAGKE